MGVQPPPFCALICNLRYSKINLYKISALQDIRLLRVGFNTHFQKGHSYIFLQHTYCTAATGFHNVCVGVYGHASAWVRRREGVSFSFVIVNKLNYRNAQKIWQNLRF